MSNRFLLSLLVGALITFPSLASAAPESNPKQWGKGTPIGQSGAFYKDGMEALEKGDFKEALGFFQRAAGRDRTNAEILNQMATCQRNLGEIDAAIAIYHHALKLEPDFPEARESLGEAYLQAVLREVEALREYGKDGEKSLEELTEAIQEAAETL